MDDIRPPLIDDTTSDAAQRSLVEDFKHLLDDGRTLVEAELAYHKSSMVLAGSAIKGVAGWGALALALVFLALMALVFGVVIGLAQVIGIWAATAATVIALLGCAALAAWAATKRFGRMSAALRGKDDLA